MSNVDTHRRVVVYFHLFCFFLLTLSLAWFIVATMRTGSLQSKSLRRENRARFIGIFRASEKLGVTPQHLRLVLVGERESRRLLGEVKREFPNLWTLRRIK